MDPSLACEADKLGLQLNNLAVHWAANGVAQYQDVLTWAVPLHRNTIVSHVISVRDPCTHTAVRKYATHAHGAP